MKTEITKFRVFTAWQDEKEEAWLSEMARSGLHLARVGLFVYTFERGEPENVAYRLDFLYDTRNQEQYYQLFHDAGWEHVGIFGSWQYFRKPVLPGESAEIFTDSESKRQKYIRLLSFLAVLTPTTIIGVKFAIEHLSEGYVNLISIFYLILMFIFVYAVIRILWRIHKLKKKL